MRWGKRMSGMKKFVCAVFLLSVALCARGQTLSGGGTILSELAPQWHMGVGVDGMGECAIPADVSNAFGGDVAVYTADVNLKAQGAWNMRHFLTLSLDYAYSYYDFSSPLAPFSAMNRTSALAFYTGRINDEWGVFAFANFKLGSQVGENMWGGRQFSSGLGATYAFNDAISLGVGVGAYSRVDESWLPLPVVFIDWKITERLKLRTFAGAALFYDVFGDSSLVLSLSAEYQNSYYRLKPDSLGEKRSVRDSYLQVYAGGTYNFTKHAYVSAGIGGAFFREMQTRTSKNKAERIDADAAPTFMIHLGYLF